MKKILSIVKRIISWFSSFTLLDCSFILQLIITFFYVLVSLFLLTSCNVARFGTSGDRIVDKNVKDSVHYELVVEK